MSLKPATKDNHKVRSQKNASTTTNTQSSAQKTQPKSQKIEKKSKSQLCKERILHSTQEVIDVEKISHANDFAEGPHISSLIDKQFTESTLLEIVPAKQSSITPKQAAKSKSHNNSHNFANNSKSGPTQFFFN